MGESKLEVSLLWQLSAREVDAVLFKQGFNLFEVYTPKGTKRIGEGSKKPLYVIKHKPPRSAGNVRRRVYVFFDKSDESGPIKTEPWVRVTYWDALFADTHWREIAPLAVAQFDIAIGSDINTSDICRKKQDEVARFLRDHYGGVLYEFQEEKVIKD